MLSSARKQRKNSKKEGYADTRNQKAHQTEETEEAPEIVSLASWTETSQTETTTDSGKSVLNFADLFSSSAKELESPASKFQEFRIPQFKCADDEITMHVPHDICKKKKKKKME